MIRRMVRGRLLLAIFGALALLAHPGGTTQAAAPIPTMTADPATGLADWQYIKIAMKDFPKSGGFVFRECIAAPKTVGADCTVKLVAVPEGGVGITGVTDDQGAGNTYVPVYSGKNPLLKSADASRSIQCDATHPCVMAAFSNENDLTTAVLAPLAFAKSPDACPANDAGVIGSGSAAAYRAVYTWESNTCGAPANLSVGYTVHNSYDGWMDFLTCLTDFGVAGPLSQPPTVDPTTSTCGPIAHPTAPTYKYAPLSASAVVLAYRIYDTTSTQVTSLTLTPDLIAMIFQNQIPNWNAGRIGQQIADLNPDVRRTLADGTIVRFPGRIFPFARAEHSAETYVFTSWLSAAAPNTWKRGPQDIFPAGVLDQTNYKSGSLPLAQSVVDPYTQWDGQGNIAFMDSSTAAFYGLPTVKIKLSDGSVVAATPSTLQEAMKDATPQPDGRLAFDYVTPDPDAYPIVVPTYMLAPTSTISPAKGAIVANFLRYAVQTGQTLLPPGYSSLPAALVTESLAVANLIPGGAPAPTPTPTPTPTATPTATPRPTVVPAPLPLLANLPDLSLPSTQPNSAAAAAASPASAVADAGPKVPQRPAMIPLGQGAQLAALVQTQDSTNSRYLLPLIALLGLLSLAGGAIAQVLARRRVT